MEFYHSLPEDGLSQSHSVSFVSDMPPPTASSLDSSSSSRVGSAGRERERQRQRESPGRGGGAIASSARWQASLSKSSLSAASPRMAELLRKIEVEICSATADSGGRELGRAPRDHRNEWERDGRDGGAAPAPPPRHREESGSSSQWPGTGVSLQEGYRSLRWMAGCKGLCKMLSVREERASAAAVFHAWAMRAMRSARGNAVNGVGVESEMRGGGSTLGGWSSKGAGTSVASSSADGSLCRTVEEGYVDEMQEIEEIEAEFERLEDRARAADAIKGAIEAITRYIRCSRLGDNRDEDDDGFEASRLAVAEALDEASKSHRREGHGGAGGGSLGALAVMWDALCEMSAGKRDANGSSLGWRGDANVAELRKMLREGDAEMRRRDAEVAELRRKLRDREADLEALRAFSSERACSLSARLEALEGDAESATLLLLDGIPHAEGYAGGATEIGDALIRAAADIRSKGGEEKEGCRHGEGTEPILDFSRVGAAVQGAHQLLARTREFASQRRLELTLQADVSSLENSLQMAEEWLQDAPAAVERARQAALQDLEEERDVLLQTLSSQHASLQDAASAVGLGKGKGTGTGKISQAMRVSVDREVPAEEGWRERRGTKGSRVRERDGRRSSESRVRMKGGGLVSSRSSYAALAASKRATGTGGGAPY